MVPHYHLHFERVEDADDSQVGEDEPHEDFSAPQPLDSFAELGGPDEALWQTDGN